METLSIPKENNRSWWLSPTGMLLFAALISSMLAWWLIAFPVATLENSLQHPGHFGLLYVHMLGGSLMLFFGGINMYVGATRKHFKFHKLVGRVYLLGGSVGAITAIALALSPAHKSDPSVVLTNISSSLVTLALAWLAAAAMAYRAVRNRRFDAHRDWMIRSYVLAWAFVFCRIASRVPAIAELGGGQAFIWLSWVAPLLLCEVAIQWRAGANMSFTPKPLRDSN